MQPEGGASAFPALTVRSSAGLEGQLPTRLLQKDTNQRELFFYFAVNWLARGRFLTQHRCVVMYEVCNLDGQD